ncbi:MAG: cation transporter [Gemmatimonadota bacterium]|nr:cation transporter [Gemmatimonadota bacterium]
MERLELKIDGMSCGHCVAAVTKALKAADGVRVDSVEVGSATLTYDPAATTPSAIAKAIAAAGYVAAPAAA